MKKKSIKKILFLFIIIFFIYIINKKYYFSSSKFIHNKYIQNKSNIFYNYLNKINFLKNLFKFKKKENFITDQLKKNATIIFEYNLNIICNYLIIILFPWDIPIICINSQDNQSDLQKIKLLNKINNLNLLEKDIYIFSESENKFIDLFNQYLKIESNIKNQYQYQYQYQYQIEYFIQSYIETIIDNLTTLIINSNCININFKNLWKYIFNISIIIKYNIKNKYQYSFLSEILAQLYYFCIYIDIKQSKNILQKTSLLEIIQCFQSIPYNQIKNSELIYLHQICIFQYINLIQDKQIYNLFKENQYINQIQNLQKFINIIINITLKFHYNYLNSFKIIYSQQNQNILQQNQNIQNILNICTINQINYQINMLIIIYKQFLNIYISRISYLKDIFINNHYLQIIIENYQLIPIKQEIYQTNLLKQKYFHIISIISLKNNILNIFQNNSNILLYQLYNLIIDYIFNWINPLLKNIKEIKWLLINIWDIIFSIFIIISITICFCIIPCINNYSKFNINKDQKIQNNKINWISIKNIYIGSLIMIFIYLILILGIILEYFNKLSYNYKYAYFNNINNLIIKFRYTNIPDFIISIITIILIFQWIIIWFKSKIAMTSI